MSARTKLKHILVEDILGTSFDGHLDRHYYALYKTFLRKSLLTRPHLSGEIKAKLHELRAAFKRKSGMKLGKTYAKRNKIIEYCVTHQLNH